MKTLLVKIEKDSKLEMILGKEHVFKHKTLDISNFKIKEKVYSPILMIYGGNGCGKTTLCDHIKNNEKELDVSLFQYENNVYENTENNDDFLEVSDNIGTIRKLEEENFIIIHKYEKFFTNFFKEIPLHSTSKSVKKFFGTQKIFGIELNTFLITKSNKNNVNFNASFFEKICSFIANKTNVSDAKYINEIELLHDYFQIFENEKIDEILREIEGVKEILEKILNKFEDFSETYSRNLKQHSVDKNMPIVKDIFELIRQIDSMERCYICNNPIDSFTKIKENIKKEIDQYTEALKNDNELAELMKFQDLCCKNSWNNSITICLSELLKMIYSNNLDDKRYFIELISEIDKLNTLKTQLLISLENYLINEIVKNDEWNIFTNNLKKIKDLNENRRVISPDQFTFMKSIIDDFVKKDILSFDKKSVFIKNREVMEQLSLGQKNFITFCYSLLLMTKKEKKDSVIIFDDPLSSFDWEYKYFISYLLNLFANEKEIPFIIFTHSLDLMNIQIKSGFLNVARYYFIKSKQYWPECKELGFIQTNNHDINLLSFDSFLKYIKSIISRLIDFEETQFLIFLSLPILRSFSYRINDTVLKKSLHSFLHYPGKEISIDECIKDKITNYLIGSTDTSEKFFRNVNNFFNDDIICWMMERKGFIEKYETSEIIKNVFNSIFQSLLSRFIIEKNCKLGTHSSEDENASLRNLIDNSNLDKQDKTYLKGIRFLFQSPIHMENYNLYDYGLSYNAKFSQKIIEKMSEIFKKATLI